VLAKHATELQPNETLCWISLGNMKLAMGMIKDAIAAYQRAVAISPLEPTPHYNLALARKKVGDLDGAARSLTRFLNCAATLDGRRTAAEKMLDEIKRSGR
jgi:predicted Zn-dependent protease